MGHLTLIAEEVCKFGNREGVEQNILDRVNRDDWIHYVEGILTETRDRDNAVLGGVRPQDSAAVRGMGVGMGVGGGGPGGGGFTSNTASTLASAGITPQDSLAMSEGTVGQSFEINSGTMLSGFGDGDEDEEMEDDGLDGDARGERKTGMGMHVEDDEQVGELSFEDVDMDYR